jgi:imidazolonepropionase-like amidohydrolase
MNRSNNDHMALLGGIIYPGPTEEPIRDGVLLIVGKQIIAVGHRREVSIPPGARVLDCSGAAITAGFWNSHVHFFERKWADAKNIPAPELARQLQDAFTRYGFTSVFDTGSAWENTRKIRDRVESEEVAGPRIHSTGEILIAPGALPSEVVLRMMGAMATPAYEIASDDDAISAVRKLVEAGVNAIKVHLQPPPPPKPPFAESAIVAAINEAHERGKLVFVHPNTGADVLSAARAGVDVVAHTTPLSGMWEETIVSAMRERGVALTPTLALWQYFLRHDRLSRQEQVVNTALQQLRAWVQCGGAVLFGTDLGAVDYDPTPEYLLMARAGMTFRQILASLTSAPAQRFGEANQVGRVAAGLKPDLVVLRGDPSADVRALAAVQYTFRDAQIVYAANN